MKCITADGIILAQEVEEARSFGKRLKGLMFRASMKPGTAMLLDPCPQIHTCFMRFALDVLFLDKNGTVLYIMENMKPWRLSPIICRATQTLEMPAGTLQGRIKKGMQLRFEK
jgi:hypothetical protein